ncbi:MAG: diaminopimelate epimerase, partial [Candidatus Puniceispirillaceae bacterium]
MGNDFIVLDSREGQLMPDADQMRLLADRRLGLGCDQIMVIRSSDTPQTIRLDMFNADGSPAGACGNGTRCVARLVMDQD